MPPNKIAGKIKRVYCKHFVTYEECTFNPSQFLNVVIGPNGTGKSTLVAAIVIGLGGDPKLLSRSTNVQDYIKNGKTSAFISIQIHKDNKGNVALFERHIIQNGKSEFKIDNIMVTKAKYLEAVSYFKIQIGNLCQFLPQDRVHDFAKMNPQELFSNTVKSVCDQKDIEAFDKLKTLRSQQSEKNDNLTKNLEDLKCATTRLEELKVTLERHTRRKKFVDKLKICLAKQNWLEVEEFNKKHKEQLEDKKKAEKALENAEKKYNTAKRKQEMIVQTKIKLKTEVDRKSAIASTKINQANSILSDIENCTNRIKSAKHSFEMSKKNFFSARKDIQNETAILAAITQDIIKMKEETVSEESIDSRLQGINSQIQKFKSEIAKRMKQHTDINTQLDEKYTAPIEHYKIRIERANRINEEKMQILRMKFNDVYRAVDWLKDNHHLFQGKVYNPILLELNVKDPNHAKYVENTISIRDLLTFTCENKSDLSIFVQELPVKQKLAVNVAYSPSASGCEYHAEQPIKNLSEYGFHSYLIDLIEGPPCILNHLCSLYKIHSIPIGDETVSSHTDRIPSNIRLYYGGNKRFNCSISKYSGEKSLLQNVIDSKKILHSVDMRQIQEMKKQLAQLLRETDILKNERTIIERQINEFEVKYEDMRNEKRKLENQKFKIQQIKQKFVIQEQKIKKMQSDLIDIPTAEKNFKTAAAQFIKEKIELLGKHIGVLLAYQEAIFEKKFAEKKVTVYDQQCEDLETSLAEVIQHQKHCRETFNNIERALAKSEKKYLDKLVEAKASTNNISPNDKNFPYKNDFQDFPNTISELREQINEYNARLDCMDKTDESIVREYEEKSVEVVRLNNVIHETRLYEKDLQTQINTIFTNWYKNIERIVETLNEQFSNFMASMKFVGEISLIKKSEFDFDSYGIQIMVQYRKEVPLQALDRYRQSGGERAIAIAVYTLSLQHITYVPFRCVDEINQGMDSRNERKIFEMLVNETTKDGRAQYFFVTPKLLPGLSHNKRMSVHIVFNGKFVN